MAQSCQDGSVNAQTTAGGPTRTYRGVPADERRRERRARLVEAALSTVGDEGLAGLSAEGVCARAGLTKRYFYESFTDRDALAVSILESLLDEVRAAIGEALATAGPTPEERITPTVGALVEVLLREPRRARLYAEAAAVAAVHERRELAIGEFTDLLVDDVLRASRDDARSRLDAHLIVAGTTDVVSRWLRGEVEIARDDLVDELARVGIAVARR